MPRSCFLDVDGRMRTECTCARVDNTVYSWVAMPSVFPTITFKPVDELGAVVETCSDALTRGVGKPVSHSVGPRLQPVFL